MGIGKLSMRRSDRKGYTLEWYRSRGAVEGFREYYADVRIYFWAGSCYILCSFVLFVHPFILIQCGIVKC